MTCQALPSVYYYYKAQKRSEEQLPLNVIIIAVIIFLCVAQSLPETSREHAPQTLFP